MSQDYTALIAKWNTLTGTTQSKMDQINALTVTGTVPATMYTTGDQLLNCINYTEFLLLTAQEQSNLLSMLHVPGQLIGGSAQTSHMVSGMIVDLFLTKHAGPTTIANLTALAKATVTPWCNTPVAQGGGGLASPTINQNDLVAAGGLV
jgi:hypothetical protein